MLPRGLVMVGSWRVLELISLEGLVGKVYRAFIVSVGVLVGFELGGTVQYPGTK